MATVAVGVHHQTGHFVAVCAWILSCDKVLYMCQSVTAKNVLLALSIMKLALARPGGDLIPLNAMWLWCHIWFSETYPQGCENLFLYILYVIFC